ncbi:MAG: ThuA domain-containing protein [Lentisphaeria bacterium]|nr:ThuA domain-containing protein [Lentisphaeria bacterium]
MIRITIWNEFRHEKTEPVKSVYPNGMHCAIAAGIAAEDLTIHCVALDDPEQGLPDELLKNTDVLIWWGHWAHREVADELVTRIRQRVLAGMGLIVLHSGHDSKVFKSLLGSSCSLRWRQVGERERIWTVAPDHPIARGVPQTFALEHEEMYGEPFDIPDDGKVIFMSWFQGGDVFRSGVAFRRGNGRIFYFAPGHETFPTYYDSNVLTVIGNAVRWAAPSEFREKICVRWEPAEPLSGGNK